MSRCARSHRVFFFEEPLPGEQLELIRLDRNLWRVIPHVPRGASEEERVHVMRNQLQELRTTHALRECVLWFYTPMFVHMARDFERCATVYDCMDELSNFHGAPRELRDREAELIAQADVMFTGGMALYEEKRAVHANVHGIPSSVDVAHFAHARAEQPAPRDQAAIPHPRIGYYGAIDERLDLELLTTVADARPDYQFVMLGPVVKISPESLPRRPNIHYLGRKSYDELPAYLSGWDVAIMPFALNDATRFISPTKTPEYLAGGKPVVSTAVRDVVEPYERLGLVRIARDPGGFARAIDAALLGEQLTSAEERDAFLADMSWDATWQKMRDLMMDVVAAQRVTLPMIASHPALSLEELDVPRAQRSERRPHV
jgi:UDP-galactopyranose mutase